MEKTKHSKDLDKLEVGELARIYYDALLNYNGHPEEDSTIANLKIALRKRRYEILLNIYGNLDGLLKQTLEEERFEEASKIEKVIKCYERDILWL